MPEKCLHCTNGGTCIILGDQSANYKCVCPVGFRGRHCQDDIDECESQLSVPCPPGATCRNNLGGYTCQCSVGEMMLRSACVKKLTCLDKLCQNNALCYTVHGEHRDYACECLLGFKGINCQIKVQECSPANVCGEHGVCVATITGRKDFTGFSPIFAAIAYSYGCCPRSRKSKIT
jgi:Calcium-binding EGF domain/Human growth factor-like EGF